MPPVHGNSGFSGVWRLKLMRRNSMNTYAQGLAAPQHWLRFGLYE
jgi:hypothetical protein